MAAKTIQIIIIHELFRQRVLKQFIPVAQLPAHCRMAVRGRRKSLGPTLAVAIETAAVARNSPMKPRYSIFSLARNAMNYHKDWERAWRSPAPKKEYDAVIVGAGGHGLATAYYLAKNHKMTNIAVVEKGWLGGGNTGRNTTIIRSNYLQDPSIAIYELARSLYEDLS
jgi:sarcosine oxidase subunit beta